MKPLLILFFIYINYVLADESRYKLKVHPKKVKPGNVQFINTGKYHKTPLKYAKKQLSEDKRDYTVFPLQRDEKTYTVNVPPPNYAPEDSNVKTRVKKVLPDYIWSLRRKRSAEPKPAEKKVEAKTVQVKAAKVKANITEAASKTKQKDKAAAVANKSRKNNSKPKPPQRAGGKKAKPILKPRTGGPVKGKAKQPAKTTSNKNQGRSEKVAKPKASKAALGSGGKAARGKTHNKRKASRRLIAAREAMIEDYPYMVSIHKGHRYWCAGALLNPRLVVTTANCLWKADRIGRMQIRAGSRHTDHGGQLVGIAEVMKHPSWNIRSQPDNDVALIVLDRNLRFSDSVHGVDLPNRVMLPAFDDAWVTSWGSERRDGVYDVPANLQVYHTRLMDWGKCNNVTQRYGVSVSHNFICLAQTGKQGPCTRDTGAPAVSDGILWGLASWGIRKACGTERFPAMFSYLASPENLNFIVNATHYLMADEQHYKFLDKYPIIHNPDPSATTSGY